MYSRKREFDERTTLSFAAVCGWLIAGVTLGALLTFMFEPRQGRRRRAFVRDKTRHFIREGKWLGAKKARDLRNRAKGLPFRVSHAIHHDIEVDDSVLIERVRSVMGRKVTHPKSVRVEASDGVVTLSGQILAREVGDLVHAINRVPGVTKLVNRLYAHHSAEHISGLQGEGKPYLQ